MPVRGLVVNSHSPQGLCPSHRSPAVKSFYRPTYGIIVQYTLGYQQTFQLFVTSVSLYLKFHISTKCKDCTGGHRHTFRGEMGSGPLPTGHLMLQFLLIPVLSSRHLVPLVPRDWSPTFQTKVTPMGMIHWWENV